jgi:hypothetical protein
MFSSLTPSTIFAVDNNHEGKKGGKKAKKEESEDEAEQEVELVVDSGAEDEDNMVSVQPAI